MDEANIGKSEGPIEKPESEWRRELTPQQYRVLREKGTEPPFTGKYWNEHADGVYRCAACGNPLFDASTKFESGSGWPSLQGLMMDVPLTIPLIVRHAEALHGAKLVISRGPERGIERLTYGELFGRARRLAGALQDLGVRRGDRVATFCWNHHQHVETY